MARYRVYFNQINQTYFDVNAKDKEEAREKAKIEWKKNMGIADISEVNKLNYRKR